MASPRGFRYLLEPLRLKGEWDLNDMQLQLAECNHALDGAQAAVDVLAREVRGQIGSPRTATAERGAIAAELEMMRHAYVGLLSRRLQHAERDLGLLEHRRSEIAQQTTRQQRFNDGIERHRDTQWRDHLHVMSVKASKEADDAWLRSSRHAARASAERSEG